MKDQHHGPYNRDGYECRFCSNPPFPTIRCDQDVRDYLLCSEARLPRFYLLLGGLTHQFAIAAGDR